MELQLPQLRRFPRRDPARPRAHPILDRRERQRCRVLGAGERIARHLGAITGESRLQPNRGTRDSAIAAIILVDGQVDHTTGLYMLREAVRPWPVWCTDSTYADLTRGNPVLRRARLLLRRRPAPHRSRRAFRSMGAGRALARVAGGEQARALFAESRCARSPATMWRW
jgi:phosphoribosyl 1,2-cyclic phosphodiesterase